MTESVEQQLTKVVDDVIAQHEPTLPRWATARATRLLRGLEPGERREVVQKICDRPGTPEGVADDLHTAVERADAPAPVVQEPRPAAPPAQPARRVSRPAPRAAPRTRGVQARTVRTRTLADVPHGTLVEYMGRLGVVEPPWLVLEDGRKFQFLNPAAVYVNGGVEVNGWDVWKVADGRSMAECHDSGTWPSVEESSS